MFIAIAEEDLKQKCPTCETYNTNRMWRMRGEEKWECELCGRKWRIVRKR